ncbi:MAG: hypothetical protein ABS882_13865 [Lysinibacillus sp.]
MEIDKLTVSEINKLKDVFSCEQVEQIIKNFTVEQIRNVINFPPDE